MLQELSNAGFLYCKWTCGGTKAIQPGDRIFLIRLGVNPRGIVASGHAISPVFQGTHWDQEKAAHGKKANIVYIKFDKMVDADHVYSIEDLKKIPGNMHWSSQSSGVSIPEDVAKVLEKLWADYLKS